MSTSSGTTLGSTATYTCDSGYTLSGSQARTCKVDETWSLSEPVCEGMVLILFRVSTLAVMYTVQVYYIHPCLIVVLSTILLMDLWTHHLELPLGERLHTTVPLASHCLVPSHVLVELMETGHPLSLLVMVNFVCLLFGKSIRHQFMHLINKAVDCEGRLPL